MRPWLFAVVIAGFVVAAAGSASAQSARRGRAPRRAPTPPAAAATTPATPAGGSSTDSGDVEGMRIDHGRRVYHGETLTVRVPPQRPYAFEIPGRGALGYTYAERTPHFTGEVV